jgi:hypothetical protein
MAKKKITPVDPDQDELPEGKKDEDGDEVIDLYDEEDNLEEDLIYDLDEIEDDMLADETEDEEFGMEVDEVVKLLRAVKCNPCPGLKSVPGCKIAHDHGCPKK